MNSEEFFCPDVNVIEGTAGFSVEVLGRTGLKYIERGRVLKIDSEVLVAPGSIGIYQHSIYDWKDRVTPLSPDEAERERIVSNIRRAFESQGHTVEVI
jgi:hypothetical protein